MGMYLNNDSGSKRHYSRGMWCALLDLAHDHGWEPVGTEAPILPEDFVPYDDWNGGYFYNDGQRVTATDAAAIADALERALLTPETGSDAADDDPYAWVRFPVHDRNAALMSLIRFCREGKFRIF